MDIPDRILNMGSVIIDGLRMANTHHNPESPYKSLASRSGLNWYMLLILNIVSELENGIVGSCAISKNFPLENVVV
jgi:hypothetical protein